MLTKVKSMAQVRKSLITKKDFGYSHGLCTLNFTLKIDDKTELNSFRKCLIEALKDIEEELKE